MSVYVNRTLNLKKIKYIGFDMDYTLVRYHEGAFEKLTHKVLLKKLVEQKKYPNEIFKLRYFSGRFIRGLIIDKEKGNILKLNKYGAIRKAYHGLKVIGFVEQKQTYQGIYVDLADPKFDTIDTHFSLPHVTLFAQLVQLKDNGVELPSYAQLAEDVKGFLDLAHQDGSLKSQVQKEIAKYVIKDKGVVKGLMRYKMHGKKLFLLTNSDWTYTKLLLDYALGSFMPKNSSWLDLFEFVITKAQKPRFFYDRIEFLSVDFKSGKMDNVVRPIQSGLYQGGCARFFTEDLGVNGDEILYIGDHIYGDILRLKKDCAWRTAMVVSELESESLVRPKIRLIENKIDRLMTNKLKPEKILTKMSTLKIEKPDEFNVDQFNKKIEEVKKYDEQLGALISQQEKLFNPFWGSVMRTGNEESYFAYQVERYSCIYVSKIEDLLFQSPKSYFRAGRRPMAHEMEIKKA